MKTKVKIKKYDDYSFLQKPRLYQWDELLKGRILAKKKKIGSFSLYCGTGKALKTP